MIKLLYKTILVSVLSGSLSIMNMTAFAQSTGTNRTSGITRDKNGVLSRTDTHSFSGADDTDIMSSITMLAIGGIAARMMILYKPYPTDVMIAAAGGAAFVAGEVMSTLDNKSSIAAMNAEVTKKSDGTQDQAQIDRLNDLKKSYEETKKAVNTKKTMQKTAAVAFAAAAVTSAYLAYEQHSFDTACDAGLVAAHSSLTACSSTFCMPALTAFESFELSIAKYESSKIAPGASSLLEAKAKADVAIITTQGSSAVSASLAAIAAATASTITDGGTNLGLTKTAAKFTEAAVVKCNAAITHDMTTQTFAPTLGVVKNDHKFIIPKIYANQFKNFETKKYIDKNTFLNSTINIFFPKAEASFISLLGLGGGALLAYKAVDATQAKTIDTFMFSPLNRSIIFGVLGGLSALSASSSQSQIDAMDRNTDKIDKILKEMNALKVGIKTNNINDQQLVDIVLPGSSGAIDSQAKAAVRTDCLANQGNTNCVSLSAQVATMPGFPTLPDSVKTLATQTAKVGDGLSGVNRISASTISGMNSLNAQSAAVAKMLKKTQTALNDKLEASGKPKIDFAGEQSKLLNTLNSDAAKVLKSKGTTPGDFLASMGGSPLSMSSDIAKAKPASSAAKPTGAVVAVPASTAKEKQLNLDFKENQAEAAAALVASEDIKNGKFDIGTNDINTNSGASLFELISNRYIKSGYPKLLEEVPVNK